MITQFRPIEGFKGLYEIDNNGNVKSLKNDIILKPIITKKGYYHIDLYKDGKRYTKKIHRLVAEAFIPNQLGLPQVNHKNEIKTDNHVELTIDENGNVVADYEKSNLEWCDNRYNVNYGTGIERAAAKRRGQKRTEETKAKMRGKVFSEEHKAKIGAKRKGKKHTEETKRKMSESKKGKKLSEETKAKISERTKGCCNPMFGKKQSEKTRIKISNAKKGVLNNPLTSKAVVAVDKDNNIVYEFASTMEAGRHGFTQGCVAACCRNCYTKQNINYYKDYQWFYKSEWLQMQKENAAPHKRETALQLEINFD